MSNTLSTPPNPASGNQTTLRSGNQSLSDRVQSLRLPDRPPAQPFGRWWLPWAMCAILGGVCLYLVLNAPAATNSVDPDDESIAELLKQAKKSSGDPSGSTGSGSMNGSDARDGAIALESKGYMIPVQLIQVSPKVAGMVMKLNIEEGQRVRKDEILAQPETIEYGAEYRRAKGLADAAWQRWLELATGLRPEEVKQAKAELEESKAQLNKLYKDWKRNVNLQGQALADKDYDQTYSEYKAMEQRVNKLQAGFELAVQGAREEKRAVAWAEVEQAEADLTKAKWRMDNTTVRAPITGMVLTKKTEEGNIVNPQAFNISASLCEMADLYHLEVDLAIPERDIGKIFKGQKCKIRPEAFLGRIYPGKVSRIMPSADRAKGAVPVRVMVQFIPRLEDVSPQSVAQVVGLMGTPGLGGKVLPGTTGLIAAATEPQGRFLRPEMGSLVTFINSYSDEKSKK